MITKQKFVRAILEGSTQVSGLSALLMENKSSFVRKLSTMLFIYESCKDSSEEYKVAHIKESFNKILAIIEEYDVLLPEETAIIESAVKQLSEDGEGGGGAPAVSGGSGSAAGSISTAAMAAAGKPVTTDAIDSKTPRIYRKKKKNESTV